MGGAWALCKQRCVEFRGCVSVVAGRHVMRVTSPWRCSLRLLTRRFHFRTGSHTHLLDDVFERHPSSTCHCPPEPRFPERAQLEWDLGQRAAFLLARK